MRPDSSWRNGEQNCTRCRLDGRSCHVAGGPGRLWREQRRDRDSGAEGKTIALLLPETKTTRYEAFDKPLFEAKIKELCSDCKLNYLNADQDASKQQQQAQSALTDGAAVLVLDPVDGKAAAGVVKSAQSSEVPVVAYDRFVEGADYYLSFDNETVGKMQAEALVEATGDKGEILMLNGAPTDPNAAQFKKGAHSVLDAQQPEDRRRVRQPRLESGQRAEVHEQPAQQSRRR